MANVVECTDRWGRRIVLTEDQWQKHVVGGHVALDGNEAAVRSTLETPDEVAYDATRPDRESYYRRGILPAPLSHLYLKVSVEFARGAAAGPDAGFVVTAYPVPKVKTGERSRWRR